MSEKLVDNRIKLLLERICFVVLVAWLALLAWFVVAGLYQHKIHIPHWEYGVVVAEHAAAQQVG